MIPSHYDGKLPCHVAFKAVAGKIPIKVLLSQYNPVTVIMLIFWFSHTFKYVWRMFTKDDIKDNATKAIDCLGHMVQLVTEDSN